MSYVLSRRFFSSVIIIHLAHREEALFISKIITKHVRVTLYMLTLSWGAHGVGGKPNKFCKKNCLKYNWYLYANHFPIWTFLLLESKHQNKGQSIVVFQK